MGTTTDPRDPRRSSEPRPGVLPARAGVSVRVRITAAVAILVTVALAGAGIMVYVIEAGRLSDQAIEEIDQEFAEFDQLARAGIDPDTGDPFTDADSLLRTYMERNTPDDSELLIGWAGEIPDYRSPRGDPLIEDATFLEVARPLVTSGGSARLETERGEVLLASQPVRVAGDTGALLVARFVDVDRDELLDTMRTYAVVSLVSLLLIVGAAFWQAGRLLAPLRAVRQTADEITETDLSRRLPLRGNDDVTALTRTFNHMLDRLEAAFVGQRQLLDDVGHELRTPLTILRGHLELLDASDAAEVDETRALLLDETDRMGRLVEDLILLAKTERPDFLNLESIDVAALTEEITAKASGLGDRVWSVDQSDNGTVVVDGGRVTQALLQLAQNAVKHTRPGDDVAIGSVQEDELLLWWVRDTGSGVAPADRARIFERFGRGRGADAAGFGLGLSIVSAIARAHGGDAWLDEDYRDGARFVFAVPASASGFPDIEDHREDAPTRELPAPPSDRPRAGERTPQEV